MSRNEIPATSCDDTEALLASMPEDHYLKITVEDGVLCAVIMQCPPEDGWTSKQGSWGKAHPHDEICRVGISAESGSGPEPFLTRVVEMLRRYLEKR